MIIMENVENEEMLLGITLSNIHLFASSTWFPLLQLPFVSSLVAFLLIDLSLNLSY